MDQPIRLIVGLGNPGPQYLNTRHNVGAWFVQTLAESHSESLRAESKFKGVFGQIKEDDRVCWLFTPLTYMNCSGEAVGAFAKFYKLTPEEILIVHDELDFPPGVIRIKQRGGHGGHNGLRNIIAHLNSNNFCRLRIGIGHPNNKNLVTDYVLHAPSKSDKQNILIAIDDGIRVVSDLIKGDIEKATRVLHTQD